MRKVTIDRGNGGKGEDIKGGRRRRVSELRHLKSSSMLPYTSRVLQLELALDPAL